MFPGAFQVMYPSSLLTSAMLAQEDGASFCTSLNSALPKMWDPAWTAIDSGSKIKLNRIRIKY